MIEDLLFFFLPPPFPFLNMCTAANLFLSLHRVLPFRSSGGYAVCRDATNRSDDGVFDRSGQHAYPGHPVRPHVSEHCSCRPRGEGSNDLTTLPQPPFSRAELTRQTCCRRSQQIWLGWCGQFLCRTAFLDEIVNGSWSIDAVQMMPLHL